jgi:threonine/homoserine/homoserine lactone efflux protein
MSGALPDPAQTAAFLLAALAITLAPGPDILMTLGTGLARGPRAGVAFGLGCACGCLSHATLAALGIAALLAASPVAFLALKMAGGIYLVVLGVRALRRQPTKPGLTGQGPENTAAPPVRLFMSGMLANAINPKVVLFFLAFLPQFVVPGPGGGARIFALGLLFTLQAALVFALVGRFSGLLGRRLGHAPHRLRWLERMAGGVFILLGLRLLLRP